MQGMYLVGLVLSIGLNVCVCTRPSIEFQASGGSRAHAVLDYRCGACHPNP